MNILAAYLILSFVFTIFVIAACMLSSKLSQQEKPVEVYVEKERVSKAPASHAVSHSSW